MPQAARRLGTGFEALEPRDVPTAFGIPWADPGHLTLSFAPDNTATPTGPSVLNGKMNTVAATAAWKREVLRGFQAWAAQTNINIGLVSDGGLPLGTVGAPQGDSRFGDIRLAEAPMSSDELAAASPFNWTGTTLAGDVVFNSGKAFAIGNVTNKADLFTVTAHEAGHTFGLDHSTAAGSVMNEGYTYRTGLSSTDIANIRAMYGVRAPDANDAAGGNDTFATASTIPSAGLLTGQLSTQGDITTTSDVDFYRFNTPLGIGMTSFTVRLKAAGLSLLTPAVTVYDAAGRVVASGASYDPLNNDVVVTVNNPKILSTYYVKVDGATNDDFGVGSYQLDVGFTYWGVLNLLGPVLSATSPALDLHSNDLLGNALSLLRTGDGSDSRFDYTYRAAIEDSSDTDSYLVKAPAAKTTAPMNLNVMVWALDQNGLNPRIRVYDAGGNPVAFTLLANQAGLMSVQVLNVTPGANYYIQVAAQTPGGANSTGGYFLGVDFNQSAPTAYDPVAAETLQPGAAATSTLSVSEDGVFGFQLGADAVAAGGGAVALTVTDASGRVVLSLSAAAGQLGVTQVQYLAAGTYTLKYTYQRPASGTAAPLRARLSLLRLSDGIGAYATDSTSPAGGSTPSGPGYSYSGNSSTRYTGFGDAYYY